MTTFILTEAELTTFLALIDLEGMNGLPQETLAALDEAELMARLEAGQASLARRGLLTIAGDEAVLHDALLALAGTAAVPEATLTLTWDSSGDAPSTPHYFSATSELVVEHTVLVQHAADEVAGAYAFTWLPDSAALDARVKAVLAPLAGLPPAEGPAIMLPVETFAAFVEASVSGPAATATVLIRAGCPPETAHQAAADLATGRRCTGMTAWGLRDPEPEGAQLVLAWYANGRGWLAATVSSDPEHMTLRAAGGPECLDTLFALTETLRPAVRVATAKPTGAPSLFAAWTKEA
jgi:hypothetical protein